MEALGYYNGVIKPLSEMTVPMNDRAVYFGDGVYEAVLVKNRVIFSLAEHLDRFERSYKALKLDFPLSREELTAELYKVVDAMDTDDLLLLYWQASRATAPRKHVFPQGVKANLMITVSPARLTDMKTFRHKLITWEDTRYLHCDVKTLNLIPSVMAAQAAHEKGCTEVVQHRGERVTEGAHSNILIIKNGRLITAPLDNLILPGITRMHLLQLAAECGIPVEERIFTVKELEEADEILVTSSSALCLRAEELDGKKLPQAAGDLVEKLQTAYQKKFERETQPSCR